MLMHFSKSLSSRAQRQRVANGLVSFFNAKAEWTYPAFVDTPLGAL